MWDFFKKKDKIEEEKSANELPENIESQDAASQNEPVYEHEDSLQNESLQEESLQEEPLHEEALHEEALYEKTLQNEPVHEELMQDGNAEATDVTEESAEQEVTKKGLFHRLKEGLTKTRNNIVSGMDALFSGEDKIDDDFYDELEEILILGDIGVHTTEAILEKLKSEAKKEHIKKRSDCRQFLIDTIKQQMSTGDTAYDFENRQSVIFVIGVNGVGKTTTIGKLASLLKGKGRRVLMAACDTFRAAAGSQLEEWSHRAGVEMVGGVEGQDPASVLFDAVSAAKARHTDVLLVDTAGRLHNKKNLMEELKKMNRIIDREFPEAHRENIIVLDASTGQNALNQAKEFGDVTDLTGIILTKMDGTAKGGIAIAIEAELGVPVKYIGVGEKIVDLQKFDSDSFVDALFDIESEDTDVE